MLVSLVSPVGEKEIVAHFHSALSQSVAQSEEERHANPFVPCDRKNKATYVHHALPDFDRCYDIHILIKTTGKGTFRERSDLLFFVRGVM